MNISLTLGYLNSVGKKWYFRAGHWRLMPVILGTQEAEQALGSNPNTAKKKKIF
jgi:hypothetical protein